MFFLVTWKVWMAFINEDKILRQDKVRVRNRAPTFVEIRNIYAN